MNREKKVNYLGKYKSGRLISVSTRNHINPKINDKLPRCTRNNGISGSSNHNK